MKICSVDIIPVTLPYKKPVSDAWGIYPAAHCAIVRVTDEAGLEGYGEVSLAWFGGVHGMCQDAQREWAPRLIGLETDALSAVNGILDALCTFSRRSLLVKAGIEMAIWDLLGKERQEPVYRLLGGKVRDRIPLTGGIAMDTPGNMLAQAEEAVAAGFRELKIKVGLDDRKDLETVSAIRRAIPDEIRLRVDANMAWRSPKTAKHLMDEMFAQGVHMVEQPLDYRDLEGMRWLREHTSCLILADEGIWDDRDAAAYLQAGAADLLHVYVCEAGGISGARRVFDTAAAFGVECTLGSMPEGIVGAAAAAHIAAAMPNLSVHPSDVRGFTAFAQDVATSAMRIENGFLALPEGPGLGIAVDPKQLEALRADR